MSVRALSARVRVSPTLARWAWAILSDQACGVVHRLVAGTAGGVVRYLTDPRFDLPTTVAAFGGQLHLPNARFTTPPTPTTTYTAVAIPSR